MGFSVIAILVTTSVTGKVVFIEDNVRLLILFSDKEDSESP